MTRHAIIQDWKETIYDLIQEVHTYDFNDLTLDDVEHSSNDDFRDRLDELIWQTIDGCQDVIYTYKAEEISNIIGTYSAFDTWDTVTGEKFENWSQVAFANIYDLIQDNIDIDELILEYFQEETVSK